MRAKGKLINGMILGAGIMYLLDPDRGNRRRALMRDRLTRARRRTGDALGATARDVRNRSVGAVAELRSRFRNEAEVTDDTLAARVRSTLGRVVSHPSAIAVDARDGRVVLTGSILGDELGELLSRVERVPGVEQVVNELQVYPEPGNVPELQGGRARRPRPEPLEENWTPALRLAAATLGGLLTLRGLRSRGIGGTALGLAGLGLLSRAATNLPTRRLTGIGAGRRAVDVRKTIDVQAPIEEVWALWSRFEEFPRFMSYLDEVRVLDDRRSHWVAKGPMGAPVEWDAVITRWERPHLMAWKSIEGSSVENAGMVRFAEAPAGGTRIDVRISYNPPAGAAGHGVAALFGADLKQRLDDDLLRLKSLLETGRTTADEGRVELTDGGAAPRNAAP
ncbi:MAG TPA: SRPBCC family protein [Gemmatimonadales bacterium]|nr:SRPBCC family protein [Gemmatimonadales bacterium]